MITVGKLKVLIANLPDDIPVLATWDSCYWTISDGDDGGDPPMVVENAETNDVSGVFSKALVLDAS